MNAFRAGDLENTLKEKDGVISDLHKQLSELKQVRFIEI